MEETQQTLYVKTACWGASLKCWYSNACSMGNKLEELVMSAQLQVYDLVGTTETCWDGLRYWSASMEGINAFRKDWLGKWGGRVAIYVREYLGCMELCLWMGEEPAESLWMRIKEQNSMGDIVVGVCYRLPDQEGEADEAF